MQSLKGEHSRNKGEGKSEGKRIKGTAKNKVGELINAPDPEARG
jgi:hypothetical protein